MSPATNPGVSRRWLPNFIEEWSGRWGRAAVRAEAARHRRLGGRPTTGLEFGVYKTGVDPAHRFAEF
jgi:hypothetical protein